MGNIRNLNILKTFSNFFKLKASDSFGDIVGGVVVPVVNVPLAPANIQVKDRVISDDTSGTIITISSTARTFLTSLSLSVTKDVVSNSVQSAITIVPIGKVVESALAIRYEPLTAGEHMLALNLSQPVELERGTAVVLTNTNGTASIDTVGIVYFYEIED